MTCSDGNLLHPFQVISHILNSLSKFSLKFDITLGNSIHKLSADMHAEHKDSYTRKLCEWLSLWQDESIDSSMEYSGLMKLKATL